MTQKVDMLKLVTEARKDLQAHLEYASLMAELRWHSYHEHVRAGFSKEEALELCKNPIGYGR